MKKTRWITVSLCFLTLLICSGVIDIVTTPAETEEANAEAEFYLVTYTLPTPPITFSHDGCTLWPDTLFGNNWESACLEHDIAYWAGGDVSYKDIADQKLALAVHNSGTLGLHLSPLMQYGVHYFGDSLLTKVLNAHWGYGWE